jgi:hypothetical protein
MSRQRSYEDHMRTKAMQARQAIIGSGTWSRAERA